MGDTNNIAGLRHLSLANWSSDSFDEITALPTDGEVAVPVSENYSTYKKIEVVNSGRINLLARNFNISAFISLVASAVVIILARTTFSSTLEEIPGFLPSVTIYEFPASFTLVDSLLSFGVFAYSIFLFSAFLFILFTEGRKKVLNEQVWVVMLLLATLLYLNPYEPIIRLRRDYLQLEVPALEDGFSYVDILTGLRLVSFSVLSILYVWMGSHSYRYLDQRISFQDWRFYAPKVCSVLCYDIYKLFMIFYFRITFSEVPFASLVGFLNLYGRIGMWPTIGVVSVSILTGLEVASVTALGADIWKTRKALQEAEYTKHRSKILGFKFFLHQQAIFHIAYTITYFLILFGLPQGVQIVLFHVSERDGRGSYFDIQYAPFGLQVCILAYVTIEAYTNLPAKFTLESNWVSRKRRRPVPEESDPLLEPIFYRNKEPPSFHDVAVILPNCFVMQTHIELFNLSWYVYYFGTSKEGNVNDDFKAAGLKIREALHDEQTDTNALVVESSDRIIFAFKGTASNQNLFTDMKFVHRSLSQVICSSSSPDMTAGSARYQAVVQSKAFKRAKVHAGFADAYCSIRDRLNEVTSALVAEKERPLYFTGHSLGGALSTLASLDISLSQGISRDKILVSTFGSPRVGNKSFQTLYNAEIPTNWRFVAGGDIVSRLPKLGYNHVGRKVVLTSTGELFIDPNALEMLFWHSQAASVLHHRKSCYLLALQAWCERQSGDYVPGFWPFPISMHDSERFESSFRKTNFAPVSSPISSKRKPDEFPRNRTAKWRMWASAIDDLDKDIQPGATIPQWEKLTRALFTSIRSQDSR